MSFLEHLFFVGLIPPAGDTLQEDGMFALHPKDTAKSVIPKFDTEWEKDVRRCKKIK